MNKGTVRVAIDEAFRFIDKARAYEALQTDFEWVGTKESGACRRASLDLTRALANMRRVG